MIEVFMKIFQSNKTVLGQFLWICFFAAYNERMGKEAVEDDHRQCLPLKAQTSENISIVQEQILKDR